MSWNERLLCLIAASTVLAGCATPSLSHRQGVGTNDLPTIRLYEGRGGREENICVIEILAVPFHSFEKVCKNDEAMSMKLHNMPPGTVITVYDDPECGDHDDWQRTTVTSSRPGADDILIGDFEDTGSWVGTGANPSTYTTLFSGSPHRYDLSGKVSCMIIDVPGRP